MNTPHTIHLNDRDDWANPPTVHPDAATVVHEALTLFGAQHPVIGMNRPYIFASGGGMDHWAYGPLYDPTLQTSEAWGREGTPLPAGAWTVLVSWADGEPIAADEVSGDRNDDTNVMACFYRTDSGDPDDDDGSPVVSVLADWRWGAPALAGILHDAHLAMILERPVRVPVDYSEIPLDTMSDDWSAGDWYPTGKYIEHVLFEPFIVIDDEGDDYRIGVYTSSEMDDVIAWIECSISNTDPHSLGRFLCGLTHAPTLATAEALAAHLLDDYSVTPDGANTSIVKQANR